jgi:HEAT repeat protein
VLLECRARAAASPSAAIFRILGAVGEGEDLRLVRRGLAEGTVVRRVAAAAALAGLARRGLLRGEPVPELVAALRDPAWPVRAAAARALVDLGQAAAVPTGARGQASFQAAAVEALLAVVDDPEPAVRAAAVEALGAAGKAAQVPRIAAVVADPAAPAMVVLAALHALAQLGAATAAVLERGLGHPDAEVAKEAVAAAARLEGPEGGRLLLLAAASERWDVRHAAARAMAERGDLSLRAEAARRAAGDPDPMVARAFAEAARVLGATPGR